MSENRSSSWLLQSRTSGSDFPGGTDVSPRAPFDLSISRLSWKLTRPTGRTRSKLGSKPFSWIVIALVSKNSKTSLGKLLIEMCTRRRALFAEFGHTATTEPSSQG